MIRLSFVVFTEFYKFYINLIGRSLQKLACYLCSLADQIFFNLRFQIYNHYYLYFGASVRFLRLLSELFFIII